MSENPEINAKEPTSDIIPKRGRGRPRKSDKQQIECNPNVFKRGRGRPRKVVAEMSENPEINATKPLTNDLIKSDLEMTENPEINTAKMTSYYPQHVSSRPPESDVEMSGNPEINPTKPILNDLIKPDVDISEIPISYTAEPTYDLLQEVSCPTLNIPTKRGRGRPRKTIAETSENLKINAAEQISNIPVKRARGRPRKLENKLKVVKIKRPRGRPPQRQYNLKSPRRKKLAKNIKKLPIKRKIGSDKIVKSCAVPTCLYISTDPGTSRTFFKLPNDTRRPVWMYLAGILSSSVCNNQFYICEIHFNEEDILRSGLQNQLRHSAIPVKHLPSINLETAKDIFNDLTMNPSEITVKLNETIKQLTHYKKKNCDKYTDFQLGFYSKHSSAYKLLEKPLGLLSPMQLKKETYNGPINFVRFTNLIHKKLLTMDDNDKVCFITCIQIAIEPKLFYSPKSDKLIGISLVRSKLQTKTKKSDSVNILIAHGINSEWHIPLDIAFVNIFIHRQFTKNWIQQTLKSYGMLHVKGYAWYPNYAEYPNSAKLFATLDPFEEELKNQVGFIFYDLPFLLKLLYFNMKSNIYSFGEFNAKLDDLKELYAIDSRRTYPLAPNLSSNNVNLSTFDQLTYEHIKEVFSDDTAAALRTYTEAELIKAEGTAIFVENISLLIKICDSNDKLTNEAKESIVFRVKEFLKTVEYEQINHSIDSLSNILDIYIEDTDFFSKISKYLLHNYVHRFVDNILNNSISEKPTSIEVEKAYRKIFIENILKPMKRNVSFDEALNIAQKELRIHPFCLFNTNEHVNLRFKPSDYKLYMLEREDRILYVAGYILKKCLLYHNNCGIFKDYINSYTEDDKLLSKSIQKDIDEGNCSMLKHEFVEFIEILEIIFLGHFLKVATREFVIKILLKSNEMQAVKFTSACPCFPLSYAKELFLRIRIDYVLTYNNMNEDDKSNLLQCISL